MADPFLVAEDLVVRFGGLTAVDGVSLRVDESEIVGLIGPNGAGKTTTFGALIGLVPLAEGTIRIAGVDVGGLAPHRRARLGVGRTFQRLELFGSMTVRENLLFATEAPALGASPLRLLGGHGNQDPDLVDELLDELGLAGHTEAPAASLPIGLARLLEFARALCTRPRLLLLDEPSSGLDPAETAAFGTQVEAACGRRGAGVLLIEHDMALVTRICERLTVIDFGRPLAAGPTRDVIADPVVRAAYLGSTDVA